MNELPALDHPEPEERSPRQRWWDQLRATADLRPDQRAYAIRAFVRQNLTAGFARDVEPSAPVSVSEIFGHGLGDPAGAAYWDVWLAEPIDEGSAAELLFLHRCEDPRPLVMGAPQLPLANWRAEALEGVLAARNDGVGSPARTRLCDLVAWLLDNPRRAHIVPVSLAEYLRRQAEAPASESAGSAGGNPRRVSRAPRPADDLAFQSYVRRLAASGSAITRETAAEWACERGLTRAWSREAIRKLPEGLRLRRGNRRPSATK